MTHYLVRAEPRWERLPVLEGKLRSGAIEALEPFGPELARALLDARIDEEGTAVWEEEDHCDPPLARERKAVLEDHFDDIEVEPVEPGEGWKRISLLPRLIEEIPEAPGPPEH
ncbi:MAG: hypothetical protein R3199_04770 [Gemmatimonadota bacterium]|nr:hypothetical protein [Gemmatimonadota bacterium]